jgi:nucleotide-binding universal stress UspA family protein
VEELRANIRELEQPLQDIDAVELTDEEMAALESPTAAVQEAAADAGVGGADVGDAVNGLVDTCRPPGNSADATNALERLRKPADAAQRDPLQGHRDSQHGGWPGGGSEVTRHVFGSVPAFEPLPADPTVAMILACNRYMGALSQLEGAQSVTADVRTAMQHTQHYMSGCGHVVFLPPQRCAGALRTLPEVQAALAQHEAQAEQLVEVLRCCMLEDAGAQEATAQSLAIELATERQLSAAGWPPTVHHVPDPVKQVVQQHMHNFRCDLPATLNTRGMWRTLFEDRSGLVPDPKQELTVRCTLPFHASRTTGW